EEIIKEFDSARQVTGIKLGWVDGARIEQKRLPIWKAAYLGGWYITHMPELIVASIPLIKEDPGNELAKVIISRLFNLAPEKFEHFVTHLLTLVGFEATATQYTGDRGVDVIGTLNPEGLANITLKAQVKRMGISLSLATATTLAICSLSRILPGLRRSPIIECFLLR
ncbi:unnamed protein product, partial [marine sediment metagenome]